MKILYYDCFAGISGDMNLGAMIDLGVDEKLLRTELAKLGVGGWELRVRRDKRREVEGVKVDVILAGHEHHDHSHADAAHGHAHPHDHAHHDHGHHDHAEALPHEHRSHEDIRKLIAESALSPKVKELSLKMFAKIAEAEGKIHGKAPDEVHFHEVGAVDSIVDIVGAAICREALGADEVTAGPVELGSGFVNCAHGTFPVPAPATAEILRGVPVRTGGVPHEATTPTGAAIIAVLADRFASAAAFTPNKIGYGLGSRDGEVPNALRVMLAESDAAPRSADAPGTAASGGIETCEAVLVECNIDDMPPERYEFVMELLFRAGAKDVFLTPIVMKKSRPAVTLSVLADEDRIEAVREILFLHTTTVGLRERTVTKKMLPRAERKAATPFGEIRVKDSSYRGRVVRSKPEYDDLRRLALDSGESIDRIVEALRTEEKKR